MAVFQFQSLNFPDRSRSSANLTVDATFVKTVHLD
jgi:hypothetical protein